MSKRLNFDFNSIKVRLERVYAPRGLPTAFSLFQFHKGAIRTRIKGLMPKSVKLISIP